MYRGLAIAILAGALGGCALLPEVPTATPAESAPPIATPTPTVEPVAVNPDAPYPYLDVTCADLVTPAVVASATDASIVARTVAPSRELTWFDQPPGAAVRQLGGFTCEWSNGAHEVDDHENPTYSGIYVSILPNAADEWPKYSDYTGGDLESALCGQGDSAQSCWFDALDGTTWLHIEVRGASSADPVAALDAVVASVRSALASGAPGEPWAPPTGTLPIDLDCAALQPLVDDFFGSTNTSNGDGGGGWSQEASSWSLAGILGENCTFTYGTDEYTDSSLYIQYYAGAAWALREAVDSGLTIAARPFSTPSMLDGDSAWVICPGAQDCALQIAVAHGWVRASFFLQTQHEDLPVETLFTPLAEAIVAQVRS